MFKKFKSEVFSLTSLIVFVFVFTSFFTVRQFSNKTCANTLSCEESLDFQVDNYDTAIFDGKEFTVPDIDLGYLPDDLKVLGANTGVGEKRIVVDLTTQTLKAYQGSDLFMEAKVSTGKWYPTPTGEFTIWRKVRSTKMSGGEGASYYYLPNVPYVMYFSNNKVAAGLGFAIHGTYWHNNFGHAMSHGCVNMRTIDVEKLFYWADPPLTANNLVSAPGDIGTKIIIEGKAP